MNLQAQRDLSIAGDVVGRDKIEGDQNITNIYHYGEKKERPAPRMAPPAPRVFIGRDEVLAELIAALKLGEDIAGPIALTALKGMGGIGKTTLAAALANHPEVEATLPEGTLWAGLGPEPEVMSLLAEWGAQLGEDFAQLDSSEARSRRLSTLLHDKKALLIVDDVWQVEPAKYFLVGGPHCRALITTRDNEIARKLAGHEAIQVNTLTDDAPLNLLRELAPKAVEADEKAANELATALDGLPLALTLAGQMLAAEWEAGLGVAGALSELKDREARLKLAGAEKRAGLATTEPSLRAILAMSYERLPDDATKRAFRLLGVFGGKPLTFSLDAATAVWGMELRPAQKTMVALVSRALVEPVEGGRYTLHTTLADFAESLLEEHGEAALAREKHIKYYLEYLELVVNLRGKNWETVESDMGQIRSGFKSVSSISTDNQMALKYKEKLYTLFSRQSVWKDKMLWARVGLEVARAGGHRELEAMVLGELVFIYSDKGLLDDELECKVRRLTILKEVRHWDKQTLALELQSTGTTYKRKGLFDEALSYYEHSRKLYEEMDERFALAEVLCGIGDVYEKQGQLADAEQVLNQAVMIFEKRRSPNLDDARKQLDKIRELQRIASQK